MSPIFSYNSVKYFSNYLPLRSLILPTHSLTIWVEIVQEAIKGTVDVDEENLLDNFSECKIQNGEVKH